MKPGPSAHCSVRHFVPSIYGHKRYRPYAEPVLLKYGKLATKYPWIYGYFYSASALFNLSWFKRQLLRPRERERERESSKVL